MHDPAVPWFVGQMTEAVPPGNWLMLAASTALLVTLTRPATCGQEFVPLFAVQLTPGVLANGANRDWNNTPEEAVELLETIAMEEGLRFAIREGGRTVGAGVVGKIIE